MSKSLAPKVDFTQWRIENKNWHFHLIAWALLYVFLVWIEKSDRALAFTLILEAVNVLFYMILIYVNLLYLIPSFLSDKNFLKYSLSLLGMVVLITPIKLLILYLLFGAYEGARQSLIAGQSWYFLTNFLVVGLSTIGKIVMDWLSYQRDTKELETQTMQSELRFLKSQINPHFLFNTLNNLYALTLKKSDKAPEIVIKLSEMMRYMLYECNEKRVPLKKEIHYLQNYLDLEALRKGESVNIHFETEGNIRNQLIAPLMFIPFVENSFKHGVNNHIDKGFVNIFLKIKEEELEVIIENSKAETLPTQSHKKSGGIGLVNVKRRLDLLYPNKHTLNIKETPKTYRVELTLKF